MPTMNPGVTSIPLGNVTARCSANSTSAPKTHNGASAGSGRVRPSVIAVVTVATTANAANQRSAGGKGVTNGGSGFLWGRGGKAQSDASRAFDVRTAGQEQGQQARGQDRDSNVGLLHWRRTPLCTCSPPRPLC